MTKEEQWKREAEIKLDELDDRGFDFDNWSISDAYERGYCDCAEPREKRIEELEQKISVLLSCKNCPENKGGFICVKEYENKCLAQKIQYIKELKEENENLKKTYRKQRNKRIDDLQKENAELKARLNAINLLTPELEKISKLKRQQLTTAKELISEYINILKGDTKSWKKTQEKAEQFLNNEIVIDLDEYKDREYDE